MSLKIENSGFSRLTRFNKLRNAWEERYPSRAEGGLLALRGFEHQFLLTLRKIVAEWKATSESERQDIRTAHKILAEAVSDIIEVEQSLIIVTQVKTTLSGDGLRKALEEFWEIFNLASELTPELVEHFQFVISGKFEGNEKPIQVINGWGSRTKREQAQTLREFKKHVRYELVPEPKIELLAELRLLAIEDPETTINCWLGSLLGLGSGISSEWVSTLVWRDLLHDQGTRAVRTSLERVMSVSRNRLCGIQTTLGKHITFPRTQLAALRQSILEHKITLLTGSSGSGKSALCKLCIQQDSTEAFEYLFLHPSDIASFTTISNVNANSEFRRLNEILTAQITQKPILIIIDDLSDANPNDFEAALNLLHASLTLEQSANVHFLITVHTEGKARVHEKIAARFGDNSIYQDVELPQLPISELQSCKILPAAIIRLVNRHQEFGPALNLKLIDWLVRGIQEGQEDLPAFENDLDLLNWVWLHHIKNGENSSHIGQVLIQISEQLASEFTPDIPRDFSDILIDSDSLRLLSRRGCLRLIDESIALTHRFIGDCARFYSLQSKRRKIDGQTLVAYLNNPFWVQPVRWFMLQLALKSEERETWQELLSKALEGRYLQLLNLLIDGAILSRQPAFALQGCSNVHLPFIIERLVTRLLVVATQPYLLSSSAEPKSLKTEIIIQEAITGIPQTDLWVPVWQWLLSQSQEDIIQKSCIVFKASEAWLNWSIVAEKFPLRTEVANFTLDLAKRILLLDPDASEKTHVYLGDFETNTFACIVFALRIIPDYASWFLRVLAGRKIIPANQLEPIQEVTSELERALYGNDVGVLQEVHPLGPNGRVNDHFRKFMLSRNGFYLDAVMRAAPQLGVELLLALTIEPPKYLYKRERNFNISDKDFGTTGSDDIDVCTFKFLPLLSLLQINEKIAIELINILCNIVESHKKETREKLNRHREQSEIDSSVGLFLDSMSSDTYELTLLLGDTRKSFVGERNDLYSHRNHPSGPKIVNCLLMTLEGWFYSRPTKKQLENSISLTLQGSDTVAMLGVLITLAKCDRRLVRDILLPLTSSLQLMIWLEYEEQDRGQNYGFDTLAWSLPKEQEQELLNFHLLSYRTNNLRQIILQLWLNKIISLDLQTRILEDWDNHQLDKISQASRIRALQIQEVFRHTNWQEENTSGEKRFHFIGHIPTTPKEDAEAEKSFWYLHHLGITGTAIKVVKGEQKKDLELHNESVQLVTSEEQLALLEEKLKAKDFWNVVWASIAIILEPPSYSAMEKLDATLSYLANSLLKYPITANYSCRTQIFDLDASGFTARVAPRLVKKLQSESELRVAAFRCLVGSRNVSTISFMRTWLKEYGLNAPVTQQLINIAPRVARLITLTYAFADVECIKQRVKPDGSYMCPRPEEVDHEVYKIETLDIGESWDFLQFDFANNTIEVEAFSDSARWIPENLSQAFLSLTDWQKSSLARYPFNWEFLAHALIPVFELEDRAEKPCEFLKKLRTDLLAELLYQRRKQYELDGVQQDQYNYSRTLRFLPKPQSKLLVEAFLSSTIQALESINEILHNFQQSNFTDLFLLQHVIKTLTPSLAQENAALEINCSIFIEIIFSIGDFLADLKFQENAESDILGDVKDVWEKLIELLNRILESVNDSAADQLLTKFFNRYKEILYVNWWLRRQLHGLAKESKYKQFRREILKALIQETDFLPKTRGDDSKILVQVLAEYWDSDKTWIIDRQSRCHELRELLSHFQQIDAVGASKLTDVVTTHLSDQSS